MKTLTTLFFILGLLLSTLLTAAQSKADKMYDSFADTDGVTSFTFTKNLSDAFNIDLGDEGDEQNVSGDLKQVRFMTYNPEKGEWTGDAFISKAVSMLSSKYRKYEDEEADSNTEIWLLGKRSKYSECHIFIRNNNPNGNALVVSFYGDFNVDDLEDLKETGKSFSEE
ncbi:DUF4252 domain-containing protein [Maribellus sp. YY47]|uniref:DUF4252 domain-containing protein n=1 Tax=Maribellus sp. YY47 TaxID=2929486 RepID=UPI002001552A|nr:DUF4252 domain-containing protein [Maribellus sp. YY47]MCK3685948.1 DUF4252 domain-containing protein [Maribellus sp. YY47]